MRRWCRSIAPLIALVLPGCSDSPSSPSPSSSSTSSWQQEYDACVSRERFGDPAASPYVLPYPVGAAYAVSATCCDIRNAHYNELAYDFVMPIGAEVTAMRAGVVEAVVDHFSDAGSDMTQSNYVAIRHADGSVAGYGHTQQNGAVVRVGDRVAQGQLITHAGSSGTGRFPHLHVGVFPSVVWRRTDDVPFNFRNADGQADSRGALAVGATYRALFYEPSASPLDAR